MNKDLIFCNGTDYDKMGECFDAGLPYISYVGVFKKETTGYILFFKKYPDYLRFQALMDLKEARL